MQVLWTPAYVGLGSNLDDPIGQVRSAFDRLAVLKDVKLCARSSLFRSKPLGPLDQPDYINAVAGLLTTASPRALLSALKALEREMGRELPVHRWGPRRIDFDILLFDGITLDSAELTIPHPGLSQRSWVLYPLREIAPDLEVPALGRVAELARRVDGSDLQRI